MKKFFIFLFAISLFHMPAIACNYCCDRVCEGDFTITTQTELDALEGCREITGTLNIRFSDIVNVNKLHCLEKVGGGLIIYENESLTNLDGLENLESVGETVADPIGLLISGNDVLENLEGLYNIQGNPVRISISANPMVESIDGFNDIQGNTDLRVQIHRNHGLLSLNGFTGLQEAQGVYVWDNHYILTINGFTNLGASSSYVGSVGITTNWNLLEINGFTNIYELDTLYIYKNNDLEEINGFSNLEIVNDYFELERNDSLYGINGFSKLNTLNEAIFYILPSLTSILPELEKVEHIYSELWVEDTGICESEVDQFHDNLTTKPTTYFNDNVDCSGGR